MSLSDSYWQSRFVDLEDFVLDAISPDDILELLQSHRARRVGASPFARRALRRRSSSNRLQSPACPPHRTPHFGRIDTPVTYTPVIPPVLPAHHAIQFPTPAPYGRSPHTPRAVPLTPFVQQTPAVAPMVVVGAGDTPPVHLGLSNTPISTAPIPLSQLPAVWTPHPAPHPTVPASHFWQPNPLLQTFVTTPVFKPVDATLAAALTGGWPLPGTQAQWSPGTWPPQQWGSPGQRIILHPRLIPNPLQDNLPQIHWDIAEHPKSAIRLSGRHFVSNVTALFNEEATMPASKVVHIHSQIGQTGTLQWGPIVVKKRIGHVTVGDILNGIYDYFRKPLTQDEFEFICSRNSENRDILCSSYVKRCYAAPGIVEAELRQGVKRIDCLGDHHFFWGMYITINPDNTWHLNLGLTPQSYMIDWRTVV